MFKSNDSGFTIEFSNGVHISIQIGPNTYSDNFNISYVNEFDILKSKTAEIAIVDSQGLWYNFDNETWGDSEVKGYLTPDEVGKWIYFAQHCKTKKAKLLYGKENKK